MTLKERHELADKAWDNIYELLRAYPDQRASYFLGASLSHLVSELVQQGGDKLSPPVEMK